MLSDQQGFADAHGYKTFSALVDGETIYILGKGSEAYQIASFDARHAFATVKNKDTTWKVIQSPGQDFASWRAEKNYHTLRHGIYVHENNRYLVISGRSTEGITVKLLNLTQPNAVWTNIRCQINWSDTSQFDKAFYYQTLAMMPIFDSPAKIGKLVFMMRTKNGIDAREVLPITSGVDLKAYTDAKAKILLGERNKKVD